MDTLYTLCRSVDDEYCLPLTSVNAREVLARKRAYFAAEAKHNPLVREILKEGCIRYFGIDQDDSTGFLCGRATFFRAHEVLRKTRSTNAAICLGEIEYPHNEVAGFLAHCIPNVKLHHVPWFSLSRYSTSLGLAVGITLVTSHVVARGRDSQAVLDKDICAYMGFYLTLAAIFYTAVAQNRDVRRSAPWNSALYLDLNANLLRRNLPSLACARKEFLPRQKIKRRLFYYGLARKIESHGFDAELSRHVTLSIL